MGGWELDHISNVSFPLKEKQKKKTGKHGNTANAGANDLYWCRDKRSFDRCAFFLINWTGAGYAIVSVRSTSFSRAPIEAEEAEERKGLHSIRIDRIGTLRKDVGGVRADVTLALALNDQSERRERSSCMASEVQKTAGSRGRTNGDANEKLNN